MVTELPLNSKEVTVKLGTGYQCITLVPGEIYSLKNFKEEPMGIYLGCVDFKYHTEYAFLCGDIISYLSCGDLRMVYLFSEEQH